MEKGTATRFREQKGKKKSTTGMRRDSSGGKSGNKRGANVCGGEKKSFVFLRWQVAVEVNAPRVSI